MTPLAPAMLPVLAPAWVRALVQALSLVPALVLVPVPVLVLVLVLVPAALPIVSSPPFSSKYPIAPDPRFTAAAATSEGGHDKVRKTGDG